MHELLAVAVFALLVVWPLVGLGYHYGHKKAS